MGVAEAPQRALSERIERYLAELVAFVADPTVPATSNATEGGPRHLVTCREISGGTRGPEGSTTKMSLVTLLGTCKGTIPSISAATSPPTLQFA